MAKRVSDDLNIPPPPLDPVASREERRATGRMVALMVAFILILSVLYQAWIKRIPILAGVTVPALIMILYGGWVLFLAKKDKRRRMNAENNMRADSIALSEIACLPQPLKAANEQDEVEVPKKAKPKASKIRVDSQQTVDKKPKLEKLSPQIVVSDNDGKLSRSLSSYN